MKLKYATITYHVPKVIIKRLIEETDIKNVAHKQFFELRTSPHSTPPPPSPKEKKKKKFTKKINPGTAVAQRLRCCATNRKVVVSIPAGVTGILH